MEMPCAFVMLPPPRGPLNSTATQTNITIDDLYENTSPIQISSAAPIQSKRLNDGIGTSKSEHDVLLHRRLNPRSKNDFNQLYQDIAQWRGTRLKKVDNIQERQHVLDNELKLLQKVEQLKVAERKCASNEKVQRYLVNMSNDLVWETSLGGKIAVETSSKLYASKLARMYIDLEDYKNQEATARLGILSEAKIILESISSPMTKDIKDVMELIDRECDLVKRNISKPLSALRQRMLYLFLQVIQKETGSQIEPNE